MRPGPRVLSRSPTDQGRERVEVGLVEGIHGAEVHRNPVEHHGSALAHGAENARRPPATNHVVLGQRLEPVDADAPRPSALQDIAVVQRPQPDADSEEGGVRRSRAMFAVFLHGVSLERSRG